MNPQFENFKFPEEPILTLGTLLEQSFQKNSQKNTEELKAVRNGIFWLASFSSNHTSSSSNEELEENFFEITKDDVKIMQRCLKNQARAMTERGFISKNIVDSKNYEARLKAYRNTIIRFSINREFFIQAQFFSSEPVSNLFDFISSLLIDKSLGFEIIAPPKIVLFKDEQKSLVQMNLAPKSLLIVRLYEGMQNMDLKNVVDFKLLKQSSQSESVEHSAQWLFDNSAFQLFDVALPCKEQIQKDKSEEIFNRLTGPNKRGALNKGNAELFKRSNIDICNNQSDDIDQSDKKPQTVPKWFKKN